VGGDFRDAFGAGAVVGAGHARFAAKGFHGLDNALVVGSHNDAVDGLCKLGTRVDALNHRLTRQLDQRLSR
jgi:hypothetical protein